mgnify:CR=1 FL=1
MRELPGCSWHPVIYIDDEVFIRRAWEAVHVYHKTPFSVLGKPHYDWLCCGIWSIGNHGDYVERNGLGGITGRKAKSIEEIVALIKERGV